MTKSIDDFQIGLTPDYKPNSKPLFLGRTSPSSPRPEPEVKATSSPVLGPQPMSPEVDTSGGNFYIPRKIRRP